MTLSLIPFEKARIALGIPFGADHVHWRFAASLLGLAKPSQHGLVVEQGSIIDKNRNHIVEMMLAHPVRFTHLFFMDSDMIFPEDALRKLCERHLPVVGGMYARRAAPHVPLIFEREPSGNYRVADLCPDVAGLQKVDGLGTGCLLIRREVLEAIGKPWFLITYENGVHKGEDLHFCERCRARGFDVCVDTTVTPGHIASACVTPKPLTGEISAQLFG